MNTLFGSRCGRLSLTLLLGALGGSSLYCQDSGEEEVFELSPFVVDSSGDVGYNASNTTSATRLNERIKDLPMNIQALTADLLDDVAATDVIEALAHVAGVEPTGDSNDREINFRGINSRFARRNQFVWYNPTDGYSTDRIEVVRGPSSLLYGQSEPGGLVNTITKKPVAGNNFQVVKTRFSGYGTVRGELDINFGDLLGNEKLSLRIAAMDENADSWYKLYERSKEGLYITARYRFAEKSEFRVEWEDGEIDEGKQLQGIESFNGVKLPEAVDGSGAPLLGNVFSKEDTRTFSGLDDTRTRKYNNIAYYVEGTLFEDRFSYQLAHNEQEQSQEGHAVQGANTIRFGNFTDSVTNQSYTNAYYVQAQRQLFSNGNKVVTDRVTGSYQFDAFGSEQNVVFGYDKRTDTFDLLSIQERAGNANTPNGARYNWRIAIEDSPAWSFGLPLDEARSGYLMKPNNAIQNEESLDAYFVALSGKYLDKKLHVLAGWRRDDYQKIDRPNGHLDYYEGLSGGEYSLVDDDEIDSYNAGFTYAINDRVNLYGNYSESFKAAGAVREDPNGNALGAAIGTGTEVGLKFDTADRMISGTLSYYELDFEGDQVNIGANSTDRNAIDPNSDLNGRHGGNWLSLDTGGKGAEFQLVANPTKNLRLQFGYGYIMEGKVTEAFAMQASFNDSYAVDANGNPLNEGGTRVVFNNGTASTADDRLATAADIVWTADGQSIANYDQFGFANDNDSRLGGNGVSGLKVNPYTNQAMTIIVVREAGDKTDPWSRHNINFVAKYSWSEGSLKGFSLGGTARGRYDNFAGDSTTNPDYMVFDLILGYSRKFETFNWNTQINVKNVFDEEYFTGRQYGSWGDEREIVWSNTFRF